MPTSPTPLAIGPIDLTCIDGDSISSDSPESAVYALILRVDPATGNTALGVVKEMPPEDKIVVDSIIAAASKARTGRVAIDALQLVHELFARTYGTPEQRRRSLLVVKGGR